MYWVAALLSLIWCLLLVWHAQPTFNIKYWWILLYFVLQLHGSEMFLFVYFLRLHWESLTSLGFFKAQQTLTVSHPGSLGWYKCKSEENWDNYYVLKVITIFFCVLLILKMELLYCCYFKTLCQEEWPELICLLENEQWVQRKK